MALSYQENGLLVEGIHELSLDEFTAEYGYNEYRMSLISGLMMALDELKSAGCKIVYVDGSFVTKKENPGDFDACWEHEGVNLKKLKEEHPLFFEFKNGRSAQKIHYKGELMPARAKAKLDPVTYYFDFFQKDEEDYKKGIIRLTL
jgi:hypothetical protein